MPSLEWACFFDGYDAAEAAAGARLADALVARFARPAAAGTREIVITPAHQVAGWCAMLWTPRRCGGSA